MTKLTSPDVFPQTPGVSDSESTPSINSHPQRAPWIIAGSVVLAAVIIGGVLLFIKSSGTTCEDFRNAIIEAARDMRTSYQTVQAEERYLGYVPVGGKNVYEPAEGCNLGVMYGGFEPAPVKDPEDPPTTYEANRNDILGFEAFYPWDWLPSRGDKLAWKVDEAFDPLPAPFNHYAFSAVASRDDVEDPTFGDDRFGLNIVVQPTTATSQAEFVAPFVESMSLDGLPVEGTESLVMKRTGITGTSFTGTFTRAGDAEPYKFLTVALYGNGNGYLATYYAPESEYSKYADEATWALECFKTIRLRSSLFD